MGVKELKMKKKKKKISEKKKIDVGMQQGTTPYVGLTPQNPAWGANINLFFWADFFLLMSDFTEREDCL